MDQARSLRERIVQLGALRRMVIDQRAVQAIEQEIRCKEAQLALAGLPVRSELLAQTA